MIITPLKLAFYYFIKYHVKEQQYSSMKKHSNLKTLPIWNSYPWFTGYMRELFQIFQSLDNATTVLNTGLCPYFSVNKTI